MAKDNSIDNTQKNPSNWKTGDEPITGAQKSYIETLSAGRKDVSDNMSKAEASQLIDKLRREQGIDN